MKKLYGLLLALSICLAGCAGGAPAEMTEAERTEIEAAVKKQIQVFSEANITMDADIAMPMLAPNVEMIDFSQRFSGSEAVREHGTDIHANFQSWEETYESVEVEVLNREWVSVIAQITGRQQRNDGRWRETNPYVYFTGLFRETDGEWKLTLGHFSGAFRLLEETPQ